VKTYFNFGHESFIWIKDIILNPIKQNCRVNKLFRPGLGIFIVGRFKQQYREKGREKVSEGIFINHFDSV